MTGHSLMLQSSWWNSGFLLLRFLLLSPDEGRNGKCLGEKDHSPHCCDTSQTWWSIAGIREEKQKQGTQLTHSSKAAGRGGREDLEDERDGFGKLPTVKPLPPVQLLQTKISANKKNQLVSAILSGARKTMNEGGKLWTDRVSELWTFLFVCLYTFEGKQVLQETRAAELKVMSEGDSRDFCTADFALYTHSLLQSCTGRQKCEFKQFGHGSIMCNVENKRLRQLLFIGDGHLGLDGPLTPFRSQQLWYDPFASEFCSFHSSWLLANPAVLCLCFHVLGFLEVPVNLLLSSCGICCWGTIPAVLLSEHRPSGLGINTFISVS